MAQKLTSKKATKNQAAKAKAAPAQTKRTTMTLKETLRRLESLGDAGVHAQNAKSGGGDNQFGVKRGDLWILANKIKTNHQLALSLWKTGNIDAQFLATLLIKVDLLSADELERMVRSVTFVWVADWLHSYVVKEHADKETLRKNMDDIGRPVGGPRRMATDGRASCEEPRRSRPHSVARSHREGDGRGRSRSSMDDELLPCGNRNPLSQDTESGRSRSVKSWGSIAIIHVPKDAHRHSPRSGSTKW